MVGYKSLAIAGVAALALGVGTLAVEAQSTRTPEAAADPRQLVEMPEQSQQLLRKDMLEHLVTINALLGHLAASEFKEAGELAERRLGRGSMGRHRGTGMGPGRFMPPAMHQLGMAMHGAASDFAATVQSQDRAQAYAALQRVTSYCVACHMSYRIR